MRRSIIANVILACVLFAGAAAAKATSSALQPDMMYQRAWRLVHENYVDKKFGGQDWLRWQHRYDGKLKTVDDANKAIETMVASLGKPGADFLPRQTFDGSAVESRPFGIGAELRQSPDNETIVGAVDDGSTAADGGLRTGDKITEVDGIAVAGMSTDNIEHMLWGPLNTKVAIKWTHGEHTRTALLNRGVSPIIAAKTVDQLINNVAYIRSIDLMTQKSVKQMKRAVQDCKSQGGLILDLRDNPGGSLSNVIEVAGFFLKPGLPVVTTIDSESYKQTEYSKNSPDSGIFIDAPMVVLINKGTASGAEVIASALKDNHRVTIVGARSAGVTAIKGINRLEDGSGMNVTIARWLTYGREDLTGKGIAPDLDVELNKRELDAGEGPWWQQHATLLPNAELKDKQLRIALDEVRKKVAR